MQNSLRQLHGARMYMVAAGGVLLDPRDLGSASGHYAETWRDHVREDPYHISELQGLLGTYSE
jgi:hypothetical protein